MKRFFDFSMSIFLLIILAFPMLTLAFLVKITSKGPVLHWSARIGCNNEIFQMPKYRSMFLNTPILATHLMTDSDKYLTLIGRFLRRHSLDELPQLFSIMKGDMSFVGPRPALFNQKDLITLRIQNGVHQILPGVTGLAQVNGRDDLSISEKVSLDLEYLNNQSFWFDLKIIFRTLFKVIKQENISH
jgi:O-antigen biosynthesis protein WbqP